MKLNSSDWGYLRRSVWLGIAAMLSGGTLVAASEWYEHRAHDAAGAAQRQLVTARQQFSSAQQDALNMRAYLREYAALQQRNLMGESQRLDWLESAEQLRQIADFHYRIEPQQPAATLDAGSFAVFYSPMKLEFVLRHEQPFVDFFHALPPRGWYQLEACTMRRGEAGLTAECQGNWVTLKKREETK